MVTLLSHAIGFSMQLFFGIMLVFSMNLASCILLACRLRLGDILD